MFRRSTPAAAVPSGRRPTGYRTPSMAQVYPPDGIGGGRRANPKISTRVKGVATGTTPGAAAVAMLGVASGPE